MKATCNVIRALATDDLVGAMKLAVNAKVWGDHDAYYALHDAWAADLGYHGDPKLQAELERMLKERLAYFGMFSDEGNKAVADVFDAVSKQMQWWTVSDMEEAMEKILKLVTEQGYREVNDTAVREEIWARLEQSAQGDRW